MTLVETGSYTDSMNSRKLAGVGLLVVGAVATLGRPALRAQAIERPMTVSVVDEAGAPIPDLGVSDFIIREDNASVMYYKAAS